MSQHYDLIIVGTGAGGSTLAYRLASSGKKILILERGSFLPTEKENWDAKAVFNEERYRTKELWQDPQGKEFRPTMHYNVGGNTKIYGAALFRMREKDFEAYQHQDGISPEWPLKYSDFEPYYNEAEELYQVHGKSGDDPTEPSRSHEYLHPPVAHEPRMLEIATALKEQKGLSPHYTPMGVNINESQKFLSHCIRCDTCDGFPCLIKAKSDAEVIGILPSLKYNNVTLLTQAKVLKLNTTADGKKISDLLVDVQGKKQHFSADIVALCCGTANSPILLLKSANEQHPNGLANSSDLVGRNFMKHILGSVIAISKTLNPTKFQKTLSVTDFYWGEEGYDYPMGQIQTTGKILPVMLEDIDDYTPLTAEQIAMHSTDWWLTTEDLPNPENRILVDDEQIVLQYQENNSQAYDRLEKRWIEILKDIGAIEDILPQKIDTAKPKFYIHNKMPLGAVAHQVGTCKFGENPETSVLDLNCRTHDIENLYVVDGSFFCSSAAVNPTLTIVANALRVADHLLERLQSKGQR